MRLIKRNLDVRTNLAETADTHCIDPSRLVFATRVPYIADHLPRHRHADVCLDTFPYKGHTTSDTRLAGVSLVTLTGNNFAGRVASSLLYDAEIAQWCCQDISSYIELAKVISVVDPHAVKRELKERCADRWLISEKQQAFAFGEILV
jgi:predicted O-linked N-acetylglucosamine transferase (SPINDLY family)